MNAKTTNDWHEANQRYLMASLAKVREVLKHQATQEQNSSDKYKHNNNAQQVLQEAACTMSEPSALETLMAIFDLSSFERDVLLLCAGSELDSDFASLCSAAQADPLRTFPTFSLALAVLPDPHWNALTPEAPLRRWRLIEVGKGNVFTLSPLRIDERVLHYLMGLQYLDERLAGIIQPLFTSGVLVPSHRDLVQRLTMIWSKAADTSALSVVQLCGDEVSSKRDIASAACAALGLNLKVLSSSSIPSGPDEVEALIRLWEREAALSSSALLIDCEEMDTTDPAHERSVNRVIESMSGVLVVSGRERRRTGKRPVITIDVSKPAPDEQREIWQNMLGKKASDLNGHLEVLVSQFNLNTATIRNTCVELMGSMSDDDKTISGNVLWDACRMQSRTGMDDLAQRIEPAATWDDLVLPEMQRQILREIALHVRQRSRVYKNWGFAGKGSRGLGISALFVGASGTGKTMTAEVLANELQLDLYRIDLSQIVSKYIGETEKNLRRVFYAAEEGGAILLFDEADALFGKRSEVKDSHDRYANIEVSYLLQRMETYHGLAILTTNMKSALDTAFLRRIRFIVQFPFPDAAQRAEIWGRIFPSSTPTENIDANMLSRLNVAGGNIYNIALNAAFLAANAGEPVRMIHLLQAARTEYVKLEKPLTEAESGGWV